MFEEAVLAQADASGADFRFADFTRANVSRMNFERADITGADLRNAQGLTQAQLDSACGDRHPVCVCPPLEDHREEAE